MGGTFYRPEAQPLKPPRPEIAALHQMALIGDIEAVRSYANALKQKDVSFAPFLTQIELLAGSFQISKLCRFLEEHLAE
ncbi:MAG: hypothetical protein Kow0031_20610 [Anaerolineae bacterium]